MRVNQRFRALKKSQRHQRALRHAFCIGAYILAYIPAYIPFAAHVPRCEQINQQAFQLRRHTQFAAFGLEADLLARA